MRGDEVFIIVRCPRQTRKRCAVIGVFLVRYGVSSPSRHEATSSELGGAPTDCEGEKAFPHLLYFSSINSELQEFVKTPARLPTDASSHWSLESIRLARHLRPAMTTVRPTLNRGSRNLL